MAVLIVAQITEINQNTVKSKYLSQMQQRYSQIAISLPSNNNNWYQNRIINLIGIEKITTSSWVQMTLKKKTFIKSHKIVASDWSGSNFTSVFSKLIYKLIFWNSLWVIATEVMMN